ncbi:hypothetical protein B0T26DRAFT_669898 [Lasiosphaeria miniovina]|uniref:Uncharacterized protein n=1 Tax=Lasiosphaeria miniovina TaxID=1954250 RepID=A0AA40BGE9_9PEZI|nr:uncharacterized protein B0T26DRAFT_669898 [Lasiosphaeria miniovina]KAK0733493.1 hypothetical protein B0T26DRAFT_669898 [Lasiosphaeria miniovina]
MSLITLMVCGCTGCMQCFWRVEIYPGLVREADCWRTAVARTETVLSVMGGYTHSQLPSHADGKKFLFSRDSRLLIGKRDICMARQALKTRHAIYNHCLASGTGSSSSGGGGGSSSNMRMASMAVSNANLVDTWGSLAAGVRLVSYELPNWTKAVGIEMRENDPLMFAPAPGVGQTYWDVIIGKHLPVRGATVARFYLAPEVYGTSWLNERIFGVGSTRDLTGPKNCIYANARVLRLLTRGMLVIVQGQQQDADSRPAYVARIMDPDYPLLGEPIFATPRANLDDVREPIGKGKQRVLPSPPAPLPGYGADLISLDGALAFSHILGPEFDSILAVGCRGFPPARGDGRGTVAWAPIIILTNEIVGMLTGPEYRDYKFSRVADEESDAETVEIHAQCPDSGCVSRCKVKASAYVPDSDKDSSMVKGLEV